VIGSQPVKRTKKGNKRRNKEEKPFRHEEIPCTSVSAALEEI
jgi:hypothetical protein